ncbi:MAG: GFA family protein [Granulosicoccus sp.]
MILGAHSSALAAIPSAVYGYAATAALFLMAGASYGEDVGGIVKVGSAAAVSMIIGNVLGYVSGEIAGVLSKKGKYAGGCAHVKTVFKAGPIDNHTCHCNICKDVTGQITTHVAFFNHGELQVSNEDNLNRQPFNVDNPDGPLSLRTCKDCGIPIMLDDKEKRIRVVVPKLMGMDSDAMPADYHAFYDDSKGYARPNDGLPVHEGLRPEFVWPAGA